MNFEPGFCRNIFYKCLETGQLDILCLVDPMIVVQ